MPSTQPTAFDVAAYVLDKLGSMSTMKLQKLVFYSAAYSAAWVGRPLFNESIEAWDYGPVVRKLFRAHRKKYSVDLEELQASMARLGVSGDPSKLRKADRLVVDSVLDAFGGLSGLELGEKTHQEAPWREAMEQGPNTAISFEAMREYYSVAS